MKTSVTKIMMSFALMGCLIFSASDAMAQGRSRSQGGSTSSRSQTAAVSRSNNSTAPTVSRSSSGSSMSRSSSVGSVSHDRSSATPQVSKSTSSVSRERSSAMPQVNRSTGNNSSSRSGSAVTRATGSSSSRTGMGGSTDNGSVTRRSDGSKMSGMGMGVGERSGATTTDKKTSRMTTGTSSMDKGRGGNGGGTKPIEGGNLSDRGGKPGNGGKPGGGNGNGNGSGMGKDNGGGKPGGGNGNGSGMGKDNGGKPDSGRGGNGRGGNGRGFGKDNHFDYSNHHYSHDFRDNFDRHNWSRPLPPPARPHRPAPMHWYRPVIPAGWYPYAGAPIIDRILGLTFGTFFDTSLDYLYYNGFEIDGYADNVIYLRNVLLLNRTWDDVMLCYDSANRLVNAQFIYHTAYYDTHRYNSVYRNLCRVYGQPITGNGRTVSWYGGNNTGWVTLSLNNNLGHYYTTISIGY